MQTTPLYTSSGDHARLSQAVALRLAYGPLETFYRAIATYPADMQMAVFTG